MHNAWVRANAVFFFGLSVLAGLASLAVLTTWTHPPPLPVVSLMRVQKLQELRKGRNNAHRAVMTIDIDVDMTPVFEWHVKQVFFFVMVEYKGLSKRRNQVVIYDTIIRDKDQALISREGIVKYPLIDESEDLRDVSVRLRLGYEIFPQFGPLALFGTGRKIIDFPSKDIGTCNFTFPTVYTNSR